MKLFILLLIALILLFASVSSLRIYFRTGLKSALIGGVGAIFCAVGVPRFLYCFKSPPKELPFLPFVFLGLTIVGGLLYIVSEPIEHIKESSAWKEPRDKSTCWQMLTGNIPTIKYEKPSAPWAKRRVYLILGITMMVVSLLVFIFIKLTLNYFVTAAVSAFIIGLLFIIFSIAHFFCFLLANGVCERQQLRFEKYDLALLTRIGPRGGSNV